MVTGKRAKLEFAPALVEREDLADGSFILRSPMALEPYAANMCEHLIHWAEVEPDRTFLAQRDANNEWRKISYAETLKAARSIAQGLLDRGATADRPVMILSDNSIESGLLHLAAMFIGVPVAPISQGYSLISQDHGKLKYVFDIICPKIIFAADGKLFEPALKALDLSDVEIIVAQNAPDGIAVTDFSALTGTEPSKDVDIAFANVGPDTCAKILFTSGSTGMPKGVINTHRMMCSNQQAIAQIWPFITRKPPILVDWLPWSHTFGGNHNFNMILANGGTLYIDGGKPAPGLVETTVANLRDIAPTLYFNVPRGFDMIIPHLEADDELRDHFFSNLDTIFYAAAALPQNLWERFEKLSIASRGVKTVMTSAWGSTETAPLATGVHFPIDRAGVIGIPVPGCEIKMVPNAGKFEIRVRGENITPGYYKRDDLIAEMFDEDGFYKIGDAAKLADPDDPSKGILFDGRVAEDFKLLTGSWVSVGAVRINVIAAAEPIIQDAVVAGHDRDEIGLIIFANPAGLAQVSGLDASTPMAELIKNSAVREILQRGLGVYNDAHPASSTRIKRVVFALEPPQIDANEITDKGYINQRAVLETRADLVQQLFSDDTAVILMD